MLPRTAVALLTPFALPALFALGLSDLEATRSVLSSHGLSPAEWTLGPTDSDGDGVPDAADNCPGVVNADQIDTDDDSVGDVCDSCPLESDCDPAVQIWKVLASDGATEDRFGGSVALSADGSTAIVGAHLDGDFGSDSGSAYVFMQSSGAWAERKLVASDGATGDSFGISVSLSADGSTAIVGAHLDDDSGTDSGSAYVFTRSAGVWTEQQKLVASDGATGDNFGISVSLSADGSTAIVGAHLDGDSGSDSGSAYVFTRSAGVWTEQQKLVASDGAAGDNFGISVSVSADGSTAIVGAHLDDDSGNDSGSAYAFTRSGTMWTEQQKLVASDGAATDNFGVSVAVSADGSTAMVGAYLDNDSGGDSGSAYVFTRSGVVWTEQQKVRPEDGAGQDQFGVSVSLSADGSTAIVGAELDDDSGSDSGSAYVFSRNGAVWTEQEKLEANDGASQDHFGGSVALSADGSRVIVGAELDGDSGSHSGSAYVFLLACQLDRDGDTFGDACDCGPTDSQRFPGAQETCNGLDDDCDGFVDDGFPIGQTCEGTGECGTGVTECDDAGGTGCSTNPGGSVDESTVELCDGQDDDCDALIDEGFGIGAACSAAGDCGAGMIECAGAGGTRCSADPGGSDYVDTDSDAVGDVCDNCPLDANCDPGWSEIKVSASDGASNDRFGRSVSLSADGSTALVGAYLDDGSEINSGSAYVFVRVQGAWVQQHKLAATDGEPNDNFGYSVSLSADGSTALVGASLADGNGSNSGSAYVFTRSGGVWTEQQKLEAGDGSSGDQFGAAVSLSADGSTAIAGAAFDNAPGSDSGSAYVFTRSAGAWTEQQKITPVGGASSDNFGIAVSLSADGSTAIVGAAFDNAPGPDSGSAYVFTRSAGVWTEQQKVTPVGGASSDNFGIAVSLSADGSTAIVGAHRDAAAGDPAGSAYVFAREGDIWTQQQELEAAPAGSGGNLFGISVSLSADGSMAIVGAARGNSPLPDTGLAHVFTRNGALWSEQEAMAASDGTSGDDFGMSVALSADGRSSIVGADLDDDHGPGSGSAYLFQVGCQFDHDGDGAGDVCDCAPEDADRFPGATETCNGEDDDCDTSIDEDFGAGTTCEGMGECGTGVVECADPNSARCSTDPGGSADQSEADLCDGLDNDCDGFADEGFVLGVTCEGECLEGVVECSGAGGTQCSTDPGGSDFVDTDGDSFVNACDNCPSIPNCSSGWMWLLEAVANDGAASDQFGVSVSLSADGRTALVGASSDDAPGANSGSAYVLTRSGPVWVLQQKLVAGDGAANDSFGISVALSADGSTAIVGANRDDDTGADSGSAYVFTRTGEVWTQQAKLTAPAGAAGDSFGLSVALSASGSAAIVGAPFASGAAAVSGAAHVFTRSGTAWSHQQKLMASDGGSVDNFGISVALSADGSTALVGAHLDDAPGPDMGSAYLFVHPAGMWFQQQKLTAFDAAPSDRFGISVALSADGSTVIVGSHLDDASNLDAGSAYVFIRSGPFWNIQQKLVASDAASSDNFGISVSLSADGATALVGAYLDDISGADVGSAYLFTRGVAGWTQLPKLAATGGAPGDRFGNAVALSADGTIAIAGAVTDDEPGVDSGSIHLFSRLCQLDQDEDGFGNMCDCRPTDALSFLGAPEICDGVSNDCDPFVDEGFGVGAACANVDDCGTGVLECDGPGGVRCSADPGGSDYLDSDGDSVADVCDNCPFVANCDGPTCQLDTDADTFGDACDCQPADASVFPGAAESCDGEDDDCDSQVDEGLGLGTACQGAGECGTGTIECNGAGDVRCSVDPGGSDYLDTDGDSVGDLCDNCPLVANCELPNCQLDTDGDTFGDACDCAPADGQAFPGAVETCDGDDDDCDTVVDEGFGVGTPCEGVGACGTGAIECDGTMTVRCSADPGGSDYLDADGDGTGDACDNCPLAANCEAGLAEVLKALASDAAAGDGFGYSAALSADGTTAIVGARLDDDLGANAGAAYILTRGGGLWVEHQKLKASDGAANDFFGSSVSLSADGTLAIVGVPGGDDRGSDSGAAYVFARVGGSWVEQQKLTASDGAAGDALGQSVALSPNGSTGIVGADGDDGAGSGSGSAYVFIRNAGVWLEQQKLTASDGAASDRFGFAAALSADGSTAIVSAHLGDPRGSNSGSAYVFTRNAGAWLEQQKLTASDGMAGDFFGFALSLSADGTTALVGAYGDDELGGDSGSAYVFTLLGAVWTEQQRLEASDGAAGDSLGWSVALSADGATALVGARFDDDLGGDSGAAYRFTRSGAAWADPQKLRANDGAAGNDFGFAVALSADGSIAIVGSPTDDHVGTDAGSAYFFLRVCQLDVDADGVGDACDNCLRSANPTQGSAVLGQTIVAASRMALEWPEPTDVMWVRGPLASVGAYATDVVDSAGLATQLVDGALPAVGTGYYYLVRPDCSVGSWQSTLDAEPGRDTTLP